MPAIAIVGAQWGDEAKGHVIDELAERSHMVVRCQGGPNAGHTVITGAGTFRLHLVPCALRPGVRPVIAHGVAVDPVGLLEEIETLQAAGIDLSSLLLSERAHLILPYHRQLDALEEHLLGEAQIGTTRRGIGPVYADKAARRGVRVCDALSAAGRKIVRQAVQRASRLLEFYGEPAPDVDATVDACLEAVERLRPWVGDALDAVHTALARGETILLEGAQAALLDLDTGTYPYVTSSCTLVAGVLAGSGVPPAQLAGCVGVYKAFPTRVGSWPFPSEMETEVGNRVREVGQEYGATTGRPRRCGWFDSVTARHSARLNGYTALALTKLDVFDALPTIRICTAYRLNGAIIDRVPALAADLALCEPIYEELPGWQRPTTHARSLADLPPAARAYVERIEQIVGVPVARITVGPKRDEAVVVREDVLPPH